MDFLPPLGSVGDLSLVHWLTQKISLVIGLIFLLLIVLFTRQLHQSHSEGTLTSWVPTPLSQYQMGQINWSCSVYSQYVTGKDVLCNSLMLFEPLHCLEGKTDQVLMYPQGWQVVVGLSTICHIDSLMAPIYSGCNCAIEALSKFKLYTAMV